VPGVRFFSLQIQSPQNAPASLREAGLVDFTDRITDFADTAALVAELDLIISVDTAVAHLAGALGRPVWTLLPFAPDWRWGLDREDTPWYPTMRLFRQPALGDWASVISRMAEELKSMVDTKRS
jgi:ADP-heptose:LPS heptosyltransferase